MMENSNVDDECPMEIDDAPCNLTIKVDNQSICDVSMKEIDIDTKNPQVENQEQSSLSLNQTHVVASDASKSKTPALANTNEQSSKSSPDTSILINLDESCTTTSCSKPVLKSELVNTLSSSEITIAPDFTEKEQESALSSCTQERSQKTVSTNIDKTLTKTEIISITSTSDFEKHANPDAAKKNKDAKEYAPLVYDDRQFPITKNVSKSIRDESRKSSESVVLNSTFPREEMMASESQHVDLSVAQDSSILKNEKDSKLEQVEISDKLECNLNNTATITSGNLNTSDSPENNTFNLNNTATITPSNLNTSDAPENSTFNLNNTGTIGSNNLNVSDTPGNNTFDLNTTSTITSSNLNTSDAPENNTFNVANKSENESNNTITENLNLTNTVEENVNITVDKKECLNVTEVKANLPESVGTENKINVNRVLNESINLSITNVFKANNTNSSDMGGSLSESNTSNNSFNSTIVKCDIKTSEQKSDVCISGLPSGIVKDSVDNSEVKEVNKLDSQLKADKSFEKKISSNGKPDSAKLQPSIGDLVDAGGVSPKRADLVEIQKPASPEKSVQSLKEKEVATFTYSPKITIKAVPRKSDKFSALDDSVDMGDKSLLSSTKAFEDSFNVCANNNQEDSFTKSPKNIVMENQLVMEDRSPLKKINSNSNDNKTKKAEEAVVSDALLKVEEVKGSKISFENKENLNLSIFSKSPAKPTGRRDTLLQLFDPLYESPTSVRESARERFNPADIALTSCNQIKENLSDESDIETFLKSLPDTLHSFKTKMDDAIDEKMRMEQELNKLKLELNQLQQERTTLQLELHQKEEVILKIQGEAQKIGNQYKHEIKELHNKLNTINEQNNNEELKLLKEEISKLKDRDMELTEKNSKLLAQISSLEGTVLNFETMLDRVVKESEKVRGDHDNTKRHLATLEMSFSDVHAKYERTKEIVVAYKNNEEVLADKLEKSEEIARRYEERYDALKAHAKAQIDKANKELYSVKEKHQLELNKMTALLRRLEIKNGSIQQALDQKTKECVELAALLDDMAGSVPH